MTRLKYILYGIFSISPLLVSAQLEDSQWVFGGSPRNELNKYGYSWGNTVLDFMQDPPLVYYDSLITLDMAGTDASICDMEGKLLLYTNGMSVHDGHHQGVPGADTIGYGEIWERFNLKDYPEPGENWVSGYAAIHGAIILPWPEESNNFSIHYQKAYIETSNGYETGIQKELMQTKISYNEEQKISKTIFKDKIIKSGRFNVPKITALKHANGIDWWLIHSTNKEEEKLIYLFNKNGINLYKNYYEGATENNSNGQAYFSPMGDKYVTAVATGTSDNYYILISVYDFDRSTGDLAKKASDLLPFDYIARGNLAFSPSGQFIYVSNIDHVYQYDLWAEDFATSKTLVATYDGYRFKYNEFDPGDRVHFGAMAHGPDGKIYIAPEASSRFLHTIEYPDEKGLDCQVVLRKIMLNTSNYIAIPNFPNYRLGPLDGSDCDTLGLDNHPVAKYRYEGDTLDHLKVRFTDLSYFRPETWHWDFGDNTTFDGKKPYFHTFPKNGVYNVCLTVSNENSENTTCRLVTIGSTSALNPQSSSGEVVSVFPNPTEGEVLLTLSDYIPEHGVVEVYNGSGRMVYSHRVYYGWNSLDLSELVAGTYIFIVKDGIHKISSGKIVKI